MYRVLENPMSAWRRLPFPLRYLSYALLMASAFSFALANVAKADTVDIRLDQASIMRLPQGVSSIVIGNPLIADAALQPGGMLVVTGKGYGSTNLVALDRTGRVLLDRDLVVKPPRTGDVVVVFKGIDRETYSCAPECGPRITTLGDTPAYFGAVMSETSARNGQAGGTGK